MSLSKGLVLVTGVNGYIAAQAAAHFLSHDYKVRGTVRRLSSAKLLTDGPLKEYAYSGNFEVVEVPDITIDGAFDNAVKDVTAIAHIASPVALTMKDPQLFIQTAINGTKSVLESALTHAGSQLKAFIMMSSIGAVYNFAQPPYTITEKDWNEFFPNEVERLGKDAPGLYAYATSKVASEKAFWAFKEEKGPPFSMSALCPAFVMGPFLVKPQSVDTLGVSYRGVWTAYTGPADSDHLPWIEWIVDVRDIAQIIRYNLEHGEETNGERYLLANPTHCPHVFAEVAKTAFPDLNNELIERAEGKTAKHYKEIDPSKWVLADGSKAAKLLKGGNYIPYSQTIKDTADTLVELSLQEGFQC